MISRSRFSIRSVALLATALVGASAQAIVATTTSSTPLDSLYQFVGQVNGASGVAVAPNKFLTAGHVGAGSFTLAGTTYTVASSIAPTYVIGPGNTTNVDLVLVTVNGTFPGYYNIGNLLFANDPVTMVGYGQSGGVNGAGTGYDINVASGSRRKGDNTADVFGVIDVDNATGVNGTGGGPVVGSYLKAAGGAALGDKDSGGGWFKNGNLVGISSFIFNDTTFRAPNGTLQNGAPNYGFPRTTPTTFGPDINGNTYTLPANTPYFGSGAIDLTDPQLQAFFVSQGITPVPEPAPVAALGLGALAFLRRRRK